MRPSRVLGLLLWRGGLMLAGAAVLFEAARFVLRFVALPPALEIGGALLLAGFALVMASLIMERIRDARSERGLDA